MASDKIYARVDDEGKVLEYPVFPIHIEARGQSVDWYTQVEFAPRPEIPEFFWLQEIVEGRVAVNGVKHVNVTYNLVPYTLAQILDGLKVPSEMPGFPSDTPVNISEVPMTTINRVAVLSTAHAQSKLDAFARLRNYDGIGSVVTYKDSAIPHFAEEGLKAFQLRDATWAALYSFLGQVTSGAVPVPTKVEEIDAILPAMSWE